jgi:hypothetical protein
MSCDLSEIDMEITQVKNSIAVAEATIQSLDGSKAHLAELEAIKANCIKNAAGRPKGTGTGKGIGAAWAAMHPGTNIVEASHRSGATGKGTSNTGVFEGTAGSRALEGGRRTRRSKKMRSKSRRSKSRRMRR